MSSKFQLGSSLSLLGNPGWDSSSLWFGLVFFLNNIKIFLKRPLRWCPPVQLVIVYLDLLLIPFSLSTRDLPYPLYFSVHDCRSSPISFLTHLPPRKMTLSHPLYATDIFSLQYFLGLEFRVKHTVRWLIVFNSHDKAFSCVWWSL